MPEQGGRATRDRLPGDHEEEELTRGQGRDPAPVEVECYAGYRGDETPRRVHCGGAVVEVAAVLERWRTPGHLFFRVRGADGRVFVLRRAEPEGGWVRFERARP